MPIPSTPSFRSLSQIIGEMASTFLSELNRNGIVANLQNLKPGSPYLAIFEAVGESHFKNQEQTLNLLDANDIDLAHGDRLEKIGAAEKLPRRGATFSSGHVTLLDTSFDKISTKIYQGKAAPIAGSTLIYVADATDFPSTGNLYLGRGTTNLEGPLTYSAKTDLGAYWTITLSTATTLAHTWNETVTYAQGGDRVVPAGQTVSTLQGVVDNAAAFITTRAATILDGETSVESVPVACKVPGAIGNVSAGDIQTVISPAFSGMGVTNPLPITNGLEIEDEDSYRERIKSARRTRTGTGTALGLSVYTYGVAASDEAAVVTSSQFLNRSLLPSLLVVDDGTGYEAKESGIPYEILIDAASGGERVFFLAQGQPVAKASLTTIQAAPYLLSDSSILNVAVGEVNYAHSFSALEFSDIANATAYEVAASLNSNPSLPFSAYTSDNGAFVKISAKADINDDIEVVSVISGVDANSVLKFPAGRVDSLKLYKNDTLLSKDGCPAYLTSTNQSNWAPTSSGETLVISVDGTPSQTYSITDDDFIALGLGYTVVASDNSLASWAAVFNNKIPGISCSVSGGGLAFTSNLGLFDRASIEIDATSSLVVKGFFTTLTAQGTTKDYVLDRNRGQIELVEPLIAGDRLTAGTPYTRAYVQSAVLSSSIVVPAGGMKMWVSVDGNSESVSHSLNLSHRVMQDWNLSRRIFTAYVGAGVSSAYPFINVKAGDYAIWTDDPWANGYGGNPGTTSFMKISEVDPLGQWFICDQSAGSIGSSYNDPALPVFQRLSFVRTSAFPQLISLAAGNYTRQQLIDAVNANPVKGAQASIQYSRMRLTTNTYGPGGDIILAGQSLSATALGFVSGDSVSNDVAEIAAVESGNSEIGTISNINSLSITSVSGTHVGSSLADNAAAGCIYGGYWLRAPSDLTTNRWGTNEWDLSEWAGTTMVPQVILDHVNTPPRIGVDLLASASHFRIGPLGNLSLIFDKDPVSKGFIVPMTRWLKVDSSVPYGQNIRLTDADNLDEFLQPQSLANAFGASFDFSNFVLHAHSRSRIDFALSQPSNTDVLMLRLKSWNGRNTTCYSNIKAPLTASSNLAVKNLSPTGCVLVHLASGTMRSVNLSSNNHLHADQATSNSTITINSVFNISQISRAGSTVTVTLVRPTTDVLSSNFTNGQSLYIYTAEPNFPSGWKVISNVSASFPTSTFQYTEAGTATTVNNPPGAYAGYDSAPTDFSNVVVGDYLALNYWGIADNLGESKSRLRCIAKDTNAPARWVQFAADTLTRGWATIASVSDLVFFPLTANKTNEVVSAINALPESSVTATLVSGTGTGTIDYVEKTTVRNKLVDGLLHISSATYNANPSIENYDITLKLEPDSSLTTTPNDWAHEEFRLAPTTAKNISDYLNQSAVTGLFATDASILASSAGHKIQLNSGVLGSAGAVQVSGGTANALTSSVISASVVSSTIVATVESSDSLEALSNRTYATLDNAEVLPKKVDWTSATTLTAIAGSTVVGGAGTAWNFSPIDPTFGTKWLFNQVGKYTIAVPTINSISTANMTGKWVHFEPGYGKWQSGSNRNTALIGSAYATLSDGRILVIGGGNNYNLASLTASVIVEAYDPTTDTWYPMTDLPAARAFGAAASLKNGAILFTGGISTGPTWHNTAYIFDPTSGPLGVDGRPKGVWAATTGPMNSVRAHHTMTTMSTGQVVVVGGSTSLTNTTPTTDIYNPTTDTFLPNPDLLSKSRAGHSAFAIGADQILVVGGKGDAGAGYEIFTLSTLQWTDDAPLGFGQTRVGHVVVPLSSTTFLVAGGASNQASINPSTWTNLQTSCEIYNVVYHTTTPVGSMTIPKAAFSGALLNGKVVVYGGLGVLPTSGAPSISVQRSAEIFDITTQTWGFASSCIYPHLFARPIVVGEEIVITETWYSGAPHTEIEKFNPNLLASSAGNVGTFRVLNTSNNHLIFESSGTSGECDFGYTAFYTYDSILPGDKLAISSTNLGNAVQGLYPIVNIDLFDKTKFNISPTISFATGALGTSLPLTNIIAKEPARMLYEIQAIFPDDRDYSHTLISLLPNVNVEHFSAIAGSVLTFQDKLNFPTSLSPGQDGYKYNTGLIREVTKVLYGDERDSVTYPGYAAAGAYVNVSAPLIRRVTIAVAIRARSGAVNVKSRVQAAIAKVINSSPPGPIAISSIIEEVQQVDGVLSVVMLSPLPTTANDSISVQPYEKALILDISNDIQVSFIGA